LSIKNPNDSIGNFSFFFSCTLFVLCPCLFICLDCPFCHFVLT
jgi:hypothetical protein